MKSKTAFSRDFLIRKKYLFKECNIIAIKVLIRLKLLNYLDTIVCLDKLSSYINISKIKNRCIITHRSKGLINKSVHLSRIKIKEFNSSGILNGFKKYSW